MAAPAPPLPAAGQTTRNAINPTPQMGLIRRPATRRSASPRRTSPGRQAGTAPGGSPLEPRDSGTCSSPSSRSPPGTATTGMRPRVTIPGSCSGTWPRSGTPRAPGQAAGAHRRAATSSTTSHMKRAAGPVCATATRPAVTITGPSRTPAGTPNSSPPATSAGPPHPDGNTSPNPPATPSDRGSTRARSHGPGLAQRGDLCASEPEFGQDGIGMLADRRDRAEDGRRAAGADRRGQGPDRAGR